MLKGFHCFNSRTRVGCDGGYCSTLIPRGASGCFREPSLFLTRFLIASRLASFNLHTTNELQLQRTSRGFMIASGSRWFPHSLSLLWIFYSVSLLAFKPHLHEGHHSAPASVEICAHLCLSICAHLWTFRDTKKPRLLLRKRGFMIHPGGDLLSQDLSSNYHRRYSVSLPGSERDRVGPLCSGHRASDRLSFLESVSSTAPACLHAH